MPEIKQITIDTTTYTIKDETARTSAAAAVKSINGYTNGDINNGTVMFASKPIADTEIEDILDDGLINNSAANA